MKVLAIETSCDETGIALLEGQKIEGGFEFKTLKASLLSQAALHAQYGGVYPNIAKREHEKNLPVLYREFADDTFDAVAVTVGPGLEPALWQGVEFAKRVAREKNIPIMPVNHMEAHLISSLAQPRETNQYVLEDVKLPVLALLISGGHTEFVLMRDWFEYEVLGQTLDDAVGECFDKVARMLGLTYPGGPEISKLASKYRDASQESPTAPHSNRGRSRPETPAVHLPRPMINSGTCDVSFSGLKTAALYWLRGKDLSDDEKAAFAAEFEDAVGDVFVAKVRQALSENGAQTFVIGGGVAANAYIREQLQKLLSEEFPDVELRLPHLAITGDNATMIAQCALARALSGLNDTQPPEQIRALANLPIGKKAL